MNKEAVPLSKMIVSAVVIGAQYVLILAVIGCYGLYQDGQEKGDLVEMLSAARVMILFVLLEFPLVFLRWLMKWGVSWGTFAVLAAQMAVASYCRGAYHGFFQQDLWAHVFAALTLASSALFLFFFYKNVLHIISILNGSQRR